LTKVAVIARPRNATIAETRPELEAAATALRLGLAITSVRSAGDIHASAADFEEVLTRAKREGAGGFIAVADPLTYFNRRHLVHAAMRIGLPGMYWSRDYVEDGGLMSYSADLVELRRRVASFVDKILKGAKPADLPVEQPTKFELVSNRASRES
jgi:putative tryptophan/tyrosine transport system substrate-binding protein